MSLKIRRKVTDWPEFDDGGCPLAAE